MFKRNAIKAAMIHHVLALAGRGTKAILTVWCALSVSPAQHPKNGADPLAAAHGTEAAGAGGHLQDWSLCETWRERSEDWRDYPTLGGDDAQGLAALLRSLSIWLQGIELLGLTDADFPKVPLRAQSLFQPDLSHPFGGWDLHHWNLMNLCSQRMSAALHLG